jgi:PAP2 superfamily
MKDGVPADRGGAGPGVSRPTPRQSEMLRQIWHEHRVLLLMAFAYIAIGGVVQTQVLHRPWPITVTVKWFGTVWVWGSTVWLLAHVLARRWGRRPRVSLGRFLRAFLLATLMVPVQITFQSLKQSIGRERGFPWDVDLAAIDRAIHGGPAWHWLAFLLDHPALLKIVDIFYVSWFVALAAMLVWLCWTHLRPLAVRASLALLMLWVGAGTLVAWLFASAGPCYTATVDPDAAALLARLDLSQAALIARASQSGLWAAFESDRWLAFGGVSAMPSLHVGLIVLMSIVAWKRRPVIGVLFGIYALAMQAGAVVLGWHYAIDGYVGALCAWAAWVGAGYLSPSAHSSPTAAAHNRRSGA